MTQPDSTKEMLDRARMGERMKLSILHLSQYVVTHSARPQKDSGYEPPAGQRSSEPQ